MGAKTTIEWTGSTWNPYRGTKGVFFCTRFSTGCEHCYSERFNVRLGGPGFVKGKDEIRLDSKSLDQPARWKKPRMIFVNSMSDTFHEDVPVDFIQSIFDAMASAPQHTYQVLTKRIARAAEILPHIRLPGGGMKWQDCPPKNFWIGTSIEDRRTLSRMKELRRIPAGLRWVSLEPLLEDLGMLDLHGVSWAVVGAESGPGARPMELSWARSVRDQCQAAGVAFFMKQISGPAGRKISELELIPKDLQIREFPHG